MVITQNVHNAERLHLAKMRLKNFLVIVIWVTEEESLNHGVESVVFHHGMMTMNKLMRGNKEKLL